MNKKKIYQIALSSFDGVSPQKDQIYNSRKEAEEICTKYNTQDSTPYMQWIVLEKEVFKKGA